MSISHQQGNQKAQLKFGTKYELLRQLGEGSFSTVYHTIQKSNGKELATKVMQQLSFEEEILIRIELEVIKALQGCQNIVQVVDIIDDDKCCFVVMELCSGGTLFRRLAEKVFE